MPRYLVAWITALAFVLAGEKCIAATNALGKVTEEAKQLLERIESASPRLIDRDKNGNIIGVMVTAKYRDDYQLNLISQLDSIQSLRIRGKFPHISDNGLKTIVGMQNLTNLSLECYLSNGLTAGIFKKVSEMTQLRHLSFYYARPPTEEYSYLVNLTNLMSLSVTACTNFTDAHLGLIDRLPRLENLTLDGTLVTRAGTNALSAAHPSLNISYRRWKIHDKDK